MKNDIYRDPNESEGWRIGLSLCLTGALFVVCGFLWPTIMSALAEAGGGAESSGIDATVAWLVQGAGWLFIALGALAIVMWAPFRATVEKYGFLGACLIATPGLLLAAGIFAMALK